MKEVIMFRCDHCSKRYASKYRTRDHEKECWKNPETKSCNTCGWNSYEDGTRWCEKDSKIVFPKTYPQIPVMHCESWSPLYGYEDEEYE